MLGVYGNPGCVPLPYSHMLSWDVLLGAAGKPKWHSGWASGRDLRLVTVYNNTRRSGIARKELHHFWDGAEEILRRQQWLLHTLSDENGHQQLSIRRGSHSGYKDSVPSG